MTVNRPSAVRIAIARPVGIRKTVSGADVANATPLPSGSQLGAGETVTSRARTGAKVARKRFKSASPIRDVVSRSTSSANLSSSPSIPLATARLASALASAAR